MSATDAKPLPCQCLRTKNPYGTTPQDPETWLPGVHASSSYWCIRTMSPSGPDEHYVHLARCVPGRKCYEREDD